MTAVEWRVVAETKIGTIPGYGPDWRNSYHPCRSEEHAEHCAASLRQDRRWYRNVRIERREVGEWHDPNVLFGESTDTTNANHARVGE